MFATTALNSMIDSLGADSVSLHSADPGANGTGNELSGGSYARQSATFAAAVAGSSAMSNDPAFSVPVGTVSFVGFWNGATFLASDNVTDEVFGAAGTYTLTDATLSLS